MPSDGDWIALGGWHPSYARVTFSVVMGNFALALIDSNGDGREFGLDLYAHTPSLGWDIVSRVDDSDDWGFAGGAGPFVYVWGRIAPHGTARVRHGGNVHSVRANADGWWAFLHSNEAPVGDEELPVSL